MKICAVICEYNPFHRGHLLHLERCRAALGEESTVLCVMSLGYKNEDRKPFDLEKLQYDKVSQID